MPPKDRPISVDEFKFLEKMGELQEQGKEPPYTPADFGLKIPDNGQILSQMMKNGYIVIKKGLKRGSQPRIYPRVEEDPFPDPESWYPPERLEYHKLRGIEADIPIGDLRDGISRHGIIQYGDRYIDMYGRVSYPTLEELKSARSAERLQSKKEYLKYKSEHPGEDPNIVSRPTVPTIEYKRYYRKEPARTIQVRKDMSVREFRDFIERLRHDLQSVEVSSRSVTCDPGKGTVTVPSSRLSSAINAIDPRKIEDIRSASITRVALVDPKTGKVEQEY